MPGELMRVLLIAALALAASGCALFQKAETRAAAAPPALAPASDSRLRFTPAFDAGSPVALMPCRGAAALGDTCKRSNASHERRGEMPAGENTETFSDALTVSMTQE
ncbi:MAG TPA: hypothetical protein DDZ68_11105 [Parvularcula sp.]|nr:hypothetical protein [Parvularcula sp.]HBS35664.1 hypothetical protein [Parvularcula sp.]